MFQSHKYKKIMIMVCKGTKKEAKGQIIADFFEGMFRPDGMYRRQKGLHFVRSDIFM